MLEDAKFTNLKEKLVTTENSIKEYLAALEGSGKSLEYTNLWMKLPLTSTMTDRYKELASLVNSSHHTIQKWASRLKWSKLDQLILKRDELKVKLKALEVGIEKKENKKSNTPTAKRAKTQEKELIELQIEAVLSEGEEPKPENSSFTNLASNLRETTVLSLSLLKDSLIYAYKMSTFYVRQIELVIESAGGMELLTPKHSETIMEYEKKVNKYLEGVKYAINPNSIFNNLKMLGYSSDLLKANEDTRVMTPDYIQKMLLEMVQGEGMRNYTQKPFEAMIQETDYADVELPSIDGRANKNKESDARNKQ